MRFIHTADWHLGRLFHNVHLTEDQSYVISQIIRLSRDYKPDAVIISGDIYDRSIPPIEAIELLNETLCQLVLDSKTPVILIAGNHDSPERIQFGARLMANQNLHIFGSLTKEINHVKLSDEYGEVYFYPFPYTEPSVAKQLFNNDEDITNHNIATKKYVERIKETRPKNTRAVVVAHAFVAGGTSSDSERPLSIGNAGTVDASSFQSFDYTALGHLHRRQLIGGESIYYSGSILKYSFSESNDVKSVNLVEMDASGKCKVEHIDLTPKRDVKRIECYINDLLKNNVASVNREDYVLASILDKGAILDPISKLREVYPNILAVERPLLLAHNETEKSDRDHRKKPIDSLFESFFKEVTGEELSEIENQAFSSTVNEMLKDEREAS